MLNQFFPLSHIVFAFSHASLFCFERQVKKSVMALLPLLAQYNPLDFSRKYLKIALAYLYETCEDR